LTRKIFAVVFPKLRSESADLTTSKNPKLLVSVTTTSVPGNFNQETMAPDRKTGLLAWVSLTCLVLLSSFRLLQPRFVAYCLLAHRSDLQKWATRLGSLGTRNPTGNALLTIGLIYWSNAPASRASCLGRMRYRFSVGREPFTKVMFQPRRWISVHPR
jgi:hypothetical protein